jgi:hypothetical protein
MTQFLYKNMALRLEILKSVTQEYSFLECDTIRSFRRLLMFERN